MKLVLVAIVAVACFCSTTVANNPFSLLGESLSEMMNMSEDRTQLYFETIQCATDVTEQMIGSLPLLWSTFSHDLENFKSVFNLMESNLKNCHVLRDAENQIMCKNQAVSGVFKAYKLLTTTLARKNYDLFDRTQNEIIAKCLLTKN